MTPQELHAQLQERVARGEITAEEASEEFLRLSIAGQPVERTTGEQAERLLAMTAAAPLRLAVLPDTLIGGAALGADWLTDQPLNPRAWFNDPEPRAEGPHEPSWLEQFATQRFESAAGINAKIDELYGVGAPENMVETLAENWMSALVPGGFLVKAATVTGDFLLDQTLRQLTQAPEDEYQTLWERLGVADPRTGRPEMNPFFAMGLGLVAGAGAYAGAKKIVTALRPDTAVQPADVVLLRELDKNNPENLGTVETTGNLAKAQVVDRIDALGDILDQYGMLNVKQRRAEMSVSTYAAWRARMMQGISVGKMEISGKNWQPSISPTVLYKGYQELDEPTRLAVRQRIHYGDMLDDANHEIAKAVRTIRGGNTHREGTKIFAQREAELAKAQSDLRTLASQQGKLQRLIAQVEQQQPLSAKFASHYRSVMQANADIMEGSLISAERRSHLAKFRPNYVPLELSAVDPDAGLWQRMRQAGDASDAQQRDPKWFLKERESAGTYPEALRVDPMDLMVEYTEGVMTAVTQNDLRKSIIEELVAEAEARGRTPIIRRATKEEIANEAWARRIVTVMEDGEEVKYIGSQLLADLLQFDPRVAQWGTVYAVKRVFENTLVGPLSGVFAATTAMRDTVTGGVIRPAGVRTGNALEVAATGAEIVGAKFAKTWADRIDAKLVAGKQGWEGIFLDETQRRALADTLGRAYEKSTYVYLQSLGGFDASVMHSFPAQQAVGKLQELRRTIAENPVFKGPLMSNPAARFTQRQLGAVVDSFIALFSAVTDAPRATAMKKTLRSGAFATEEQAAVAGAAMASDVRRYGAVVQADGSAIGADIAKLGPIGTALLPNGQRPSFLGSTINAAQESIPFVNPAIQGIRRLLGSYAEDPMGTAMRHALYVQFPAVMSYLWNASLGEEYTQYQVEGRSVFDNVLSVYLGVPGMGPERGIEIPFGHENVLFLSPLVQGMHAMFGGRNSAETRAALEILLWEMARNSTPMGNPAILGLYDSLQGRQSASTILGQDGFAPRDDKTGFLPHNIELVLRNMMGLIGNTSAELLNALAYDGTEQTPIGEIFGDTISEQVQRRTAIVRNMGAKTRNTWFSIPHAVHERRRAAYEEFFEVWNDHVNPAKQSDEGVGLFDTRSETSEGGLGSVRNYVGGTQDGDMPRGRIGPPRTAPPVNPLMEPFGAFLNEHMRRSGSGFTVNQSRLSAYNRQVRELRKFNAGHNADLRAWQQALASKSPTDPIVAELQPFIEEFGPNFDLSNWRDRNRLINRIEMERQELLQMQLEVINQVEEMMTQQLRGQGVLGPDEHFSIEDHLDPYDANPFGR